MSKFEIVRGHRPRLQAESVAWNIPLCKAERREINAVTFNIIHAKQLLALKGPAPRRGRALRELSIIEDGAISIRDGLIDWVGPTDQRVLSLRHVDDHGITAQA